MPKLVSKLASKDPWALRDNKFKKHIFNGKGKEIEVTEKELEGMRRVYGAKLSEYVDVIDEAKKTPVKRVDPVTINESIETTQEEPVEKSYVQIISDVKQMSVEECEIILKREEARTKPRIPVMKAISKRIENLRG